MDFLWTSPGGTYVVPPTFRSAFINEFPEYRIRWSLRESKWLVEQRCGRGALPPIRIDPADDGLIRAKDGYWLVMAFEPGDRKACPLDGTTMKVPMLKAAETTCSCCRSKGRDGRYMSAYWPFDERLLEQLRRFDPLRGGIQRARIAADDANAARLKEAERKDRDAITSIDAVDHRWITGIASSTGLTRRTIDERDLL